MGPLAAVFWLVARLRHARALHPRGAVVSGVLHRRGLRPQIGVPWLDAAADDAVLVRFSRATGLPPPLPDVLGLSIRAVGAAGQPQDLLLSSSGRAPVSRHLLLPARHPRSPSYSSLVPFATASGPLLLGARAAGSSAFELSVASVTGRWRPFALLAVPSVHGADDAGLDLDPVRHPVPGLRMPPGLRRLRRNAYAASRRGRGAW